MNNQILYYFKDELEKIARRRKKKNLDYMTRLKNWANKKYGNERFESAKKKLKNLALRRAFSAIARVRG